MVVSLCVVAIDLGIQLTPATNIQRSNMISSLKIRTFLLLRKYGMTLPTRPKRPSPLWRSSSGLLGVCVGSAMSSLDVVVLPNFLSIFKSPYTTETRYLMVVDVSLLTTCMMHLCRSRALLPGAVVTSTPFSPSFQRRLMLQAC
jgi:hypothetical protein